MNPYVAEGVCRERIKQALVGAALKAVTKPIVSTAKVIGRNKKRTAKGGLAALGVGWPVGSALTRDPRNPIRDKYLGHRPDPPKRPRMP